MATFALVGCTQPSLPSSGPAYLMCRANDGFAAAWERATGEADNALILSPEYGLIHPDEVLEPGDAGLGEERWGEDPARWEARVQRELQSLRWLEEQHRWLLLAEGDWADRVAGMLEASGQRVERSAAGARPEGPH